MIAAMTDLIVHRGPDDAGQHVEGCVGIGMRRLSIIDLGSGHQPVFNEDGTVAVVFNGEIYNFEELRNDLKARGHLFKTSSDTEVIVHLYEELGADFPTKLNGMFAIAVWDQKTRRLVVARDRLGVKPLYYAWTRDGLVFGSELKCVLVEGGVARSIDATALLRYLTMGYVPHPLTIYEGARQLPPGCRLVVERGAMREERYWEVRSKIDPKLTREDAEGRLAELVRDATKLRMIADVPIGAFLSGGIDSSIVVAQMAQLSGQPVRTFHIDFDAPELSEIEQARSLAKRYGTEHHELVVRPTAVGLLDQLVRHFDEPFADSSAIPTWFVSQLARQHVTVALAGDGGDESFGGYSRYRRAKDRWEPPGWLRPVLRPLGKALGRLMPRTWPGRGWLPTLGYTTVELAAGVLAEQEARALLRPGGQVHTGNVTSIWREAEATLRRIDAGDWLSPYQMLDLDWYLPDDILVKVDRMSMAHSLEVRAPFLDYRIVELAANLPAAWKLGPADSKLILKSTFRSQLTPEILAPRKRGFSIPMADWLRGDLRPEIEALAHEGSRGVLGGVINFREVRQLWTEHRAGVRNHAPMLWRLMFLEAWWKHHNSGVPQAWAIS